MYELEKLITQTRQLAADYYRNTGNALPVTQEIARFDACRLLGLEPCETEASVDAVGKTRWAGEHVLVKGRVLFEADKTGYRVGQIKPEGGWQRVVLVLFNDCYEPTALYGMHRDVLIANFSDPNASKRTQRGIMSVEKFKALGEPLWPTESA